MRRIQMRVYVSGSVQGVAFRSLTRKEALKVGVVGWVRNLEDGRVEAVFGGTETAVNYMVHWCSRGPLCAQVTEVVAEPMPLEAFGGFDIR